MPEARQAQESVWGEVMTIFTLIRLRPSCDPQGLKGLEGAVFEGEKFLGYTLERSKDDPDHPCIAAGKYRLTPSVMATSGHLRALVNDVPGRSGIFVHNANFASQLEGCVAVAAQYQGSGQIGVGLADHIYTKVLADKDDSWLEIRELA